MSCTGAQTSYGVTARCLSTFALSPFRATGLRPQISCMPELLHIQRSFASGELPPHIQMEMPALSPTMSQVKSTFTAPCAVSNGMAPGSFKALCWELLTGNVSNSQPLCFPLQHLLRTARYGYEIQASCGLQGNIASWKKKEGEEFAAGDVLAEIETDKVRQHAISHCSCQSLLACNGVQEPAVSSATSIMLFKHGMLRQLLQQ